MVKVFDGKRIWKDIDQQLLSVLIQHNNLTINLVIFDITELEFGQNLIYRSGDSKRAKFQQHL